VTGTPYNQLGKVNVRAIIPIQRARIARPTLIKRSERGTKIVKPITITPKTNLVVNIRFSKKDSRR
jgi:hypothetical protein